MGRTTIAIFLAASPALSLDFVDPNVVVAPEFPGNCGGPTPWEQIAASLLDIPDMLPTIPDEPLDVDWEGDIPGTRHDGLGPVEPPEGWSPSDSICGVAPIWDAERVEVGPLRFVGDEPHCRVVFYPSRANGTALFFENRWPPGSIHVPISGAPHWAQFRFPIPRSHEAVELSYSVGWARLFGSHPDPCHEDDKDEEGLCGPKYADPAEDWSEDVPPGLFLLWAKAGRCEGYVITGPHEPAGHLSWSGAERYVAEIPPSLRRVGELVVTLFTYRQYPGGCEGEMCKSGRFEYYSLSVDELSLETRELFDPPFEPPPTHPRVFGPDEVWLPAQARFDTLPCYGAPEHESWAGWGSVTNVKNVWDTITKGGTVCEGTVPDTLPDHPDAGPYLDGSAELDWNLDRAYRALHLIRRGRACRALGEPSCPFSEAELDRLAAELVRIELGRFEKWTWENHGLGFDLGTLVPMRYWSIFADVLWEDLSAEEHARLATEMRARIDIFLANYGARHWSLFNGNNWTPVLANAAMTWAIAYYHDDPVAPEVVRTVLSVLWEHTDFYLRDGTYKEGLLEYTHVSFDNLRQINALALRGFGRPLTSVHWDRMPGVSRWALEFTAPDGTTIDFGDSWAKRGWGNFLPLYTLLTPELTGGPPAPVDSCAVWRFFSNRWWDHGLRNPWFVGESLARDWVAIAERCPGPHVGEGTRVTVLPDGGWGALRSGMPGATYTATLDEVERRYSQADHTFLATSAVPNPFPHTELDFGTLTWIAYGQRLLADLGYGTIPNDRYVIDPAPDNNPVGHNTLVVPEALRDGDPATNTSQIDGAVGSISAELVSGIEVIHLTGDTVYGAASPELGWLDVFDRWLIPVDGGHFLVAETFRLRADRPAAAVADHWHTFDMAEPPLPEDCHYTAQHIDLARPAPDRITLVPRCSALIRSGTAEGAGAIVAASLHGGSFAIDPAFEYVNRLNRTERRGRARFVPDAPVTSDVRIFALVSATADTALPPIDIGRVPCAPDTCFQVTLADAAYTLAFSEMDEAFVLESILASPAENTLPRRGGSQRGRWGP